MGFKRNLIRETEYNYLTSICIFINDMTQIKVQIYFLVARNLSIDFGGAEKN